LIAEGLGSIGLERARAGRFFDFRVGAAPMRLVRSAEPPRIPGGDPRLGPLTGETEPRRDPLRKNGSTGATGTRGKEDAPGSDTYDGPPPATRRCENPERGIADSTGLSLMGYPGK
jgi:hypothetical protein